MQADLRLNALARDSDNAETASRLLCRLLAGPLPTGDDPQIFRREGNGWVRVLAAHREIRAFPLDSGDLNPAQKTKAAN